MKLQSVIRAIAKTAFTVEEDNRIMGFEKGKPIPAIGYKVEGTDGRRVTFKVLDPQTVKKHGKDVLDGKIQFGEINLYKHVGGVKILVRNEKAIKSAMAWLAGEAMYGEEKASLKSLITTLVKVQAKNPCGNAGLAAALAR